MLSTLRQRKFAPAILALLAGIAVSGAVWAGKVPDALRKAPPLLITEPSGTQTQLSNFQGKVVVVEFLFVRSPHCLQLAALLNRLNAELGPRGFQAVAVAFGPYADAPVLTRLVDSLKLAYPVGYTTSDQVDAYLGRTGHEILKIPQMVVLDRRGVVRARTGSHGDPRLESEVQLRAMVETLLAERGARASARH